MDRIVLQAVCAYAELFRYERMPFMTVYRFYNQWRVEIQLYPYDKFSHHRAYELCTILLNRRKNKKKICYVQPKD